MSFFGSESKVKKSTTTNVTDIDETVAASDRSSIVTGSNVNYLDEGAIEKSFDFARKSYEQTGDSFDKVLGLADSTVEQSGETFDDALKAVNKASAMSYEQTGNIFKKSFDFVKEALKQGGGAKEIAAAYRTADQKATPVDKENIIMVAVGLMALTMMLVVRRKKQ